MRGRRNDAGQVAPLIALLAVLAGLGMLGLGRLGGVAAERASARTAADAAALAGAAAGEESARRLASENGGQLLAFESAGTDARVRVRLGNGTVTARARSVRNALGAGGTGASRLAPAMRAALARAAELLGQPVPISSGYRSPAEQRRLFERRTSNPYPVAPPGSSKHERGLAVDVPLVFADRLAEISAETGLCRPYPRTDPVHFELCRAGARGL